MIEGVPESDLFVIPLTVPHRAAFVRRRFRQYLEELKADGSMADHRARVVADQLAFEDLQSLLGRYGRLAFNLQLLHERSESPRPAHEAENPADAPLAAAGVR